MIDVFWPDSHTFSNLARLSGTAPLIGVNNGYCFAGNAALLACCDVIISTKGSNIGMGGPPMIESGGLGRVNPEDIGPMDMLTRNGAVDVLVDDEAEAMATAKRYLSDFQGNIDDWQCADQRALRHAIPENRLDASQHASASVVGRSSSVRFEGGTPSVQGIAPEPSVLHWTEGVPPSIGSSRAQNGLLARAFFSGG